MTSAGSPKGADVVAWLRYLPATLIYSVARIRRKYGYYNHLTERLFFQAWQSHQSTRFLLGYLRFKRDLGQSPDDDLIGRLHASLPGMRGDPKRQALNLICEFRPELMSGDNQRAGELECYVKHSPVLAHLVHTHLNNDLQPSGLSRLHAIQDAWRKNLRDAIIQADTSLCVVGNSLELSGSGLGVEIDSYDLVFRFNNYSSSGVDESDRGKKMDVWIQSPDFLGRKPEHTPQMDWVMLSGPDQRYQMKNWDAVTGLLQHDIGVVTFPLKTWQRLVRKLDAPPSSGLLLLGWLIEIIGDPGKISLAGFQKPGQARHGLLKVHPSHRMPGNRHNWLAERAMLVEWIGKGMNYLS